VAASLVECQPLRRKLLVLAAVITGALVLATVAFADNGGFSPRNPHSPNAARTVDAYWYVFAFAAVVFVIVEGTLIVFAIRYRRRKRARTAEGPQVTGHERLEFIWTAIPVLILVAIGAFIFYKLPGLKGVPEANAGSQHLVVRVEGHRFYWEYKYPNGVVAVDRMRAPVDTVVQLEITAPADDVIHSWWIPQLGGKTDAIPGHPNHSWFKADEVGVYTGQCAELCGIQHAAMTAEVQVMPRDEFNRWLDAEAQAQAAGTSDLGKQTFQGVCAKCHGMQAQGDIGPKLVGNPLLNDKQGLEQVVREGRGQMPPVGQTWSDQQMNALYEYVHKTFGGGASGSSG
jgi:cytochrome c oxidase subunit II